MSILNLLFAITFSFLLSSAFLTVLGIAFYIMTNAFVSAINPFITFNFKKHIENSILMIKTYLSILTPST
jgi:hypothetical protein